MMRKLLVALLVTVACSPAVVEGQEEHTSTTLPQSTATSGVTTDQPQGTTATTTEAVDTPGTTLSDRPLAPDFTLELGDGGSYTLSEGEKPVYLVFWAEW